MVEDSGVFGDADMIPLPCNPESISIFLTTHYMDEAEYCDRIAIIDHGKIIALDTPEALKASVGKDRVQIHTDDDGAAIVALDAHFGLTATVVEGAVTFAVERGEQFVPRLFADFPLPIRAVNVARPTLDDVFMSYTGTTIRDAETTTGQRGRETMQMFREGTAMTTTAPVAQIRVPVRTAGSELRAIKIVWQRELIRFFNDRLRMITSLVQPFLFLFVLGSGLSRLTQAAPAGCRCARSSTPASSPWPSCSRRMFSAASIVWDREFGFLREMLVAPVRRSSIVIGKCLGGATVAAFQGVIVIAIAGLVGVPYDADADPRVFGIQLLLAFTITAFGVMMAARVKQMQSFMALTQMLVLPLFFLSGAMFPASHLPPWLTVLNRIDPLTYAVDPMRRVVFSHLHLAAGRARPPRPGSHLERLARADAARGRNRRCDGPRDARRRHRRVQPHRVARTGGRVGRTSSAGEHADRA